MDDFDNLSLTGDSTSSSSSSDSKVFTANQLIVLELHNIKKDQPASERTTNNALKERTKKKRRRSHPVVQTKTDSSASSSASIPTATDSGKEEFCDADGTGMDHDVAAKDGQAKPTAALALALQHSEHNQDPKLITETQPLTSDLREILNTLKKPCCTKIADNQELILGEENILRK